MGSRRRGIRTWGVLALAMLGLGACSGSSVTRSSSAPTSTSDDIGADVPVRVTASAVKPSTLHLFNGLQATFVNEDAGPRSIGVDAARSDQAGCAAVAMVLQPGQPKMTDALPRFAACYFRDSKRPDDTAFQGVIVTH